MASVGRLYSIYQDLKVNFQTNGQGKLVQKECTALHYPAITCIELEYDIASDVRGLRESIQLTELKNFTIALSVFIVVDNYI